MNTDNKTLPEQLRLAADIIEKKLPFEHFCPEMPTLGWMSGECKDPIQRLAHGNKIRLAPVVTSEAKEPVPQCPWCIPGIDNCHHSAAEIQTHYAVPITGPVQDSVSAEADPYAELKAAHAAGKRIQYRCDPEFKGLPTEWTDCGNPVFAIGSQYRIHPDDITPAPFDLDAHLAKSGFKLGPGQSWHRLDWTAEMLPARTRPLLLGEKIQPLLDFGLFVEGWVECRMEQTITDPGCEFNHRRTTRPLPPAPATAEKSLGEICYEGYYKNSSEYDYNKAAKAFWQEAAQAVAAHVSAPLKVEIERLRRDQLKIWQSATAAGWNGTENPKCVWDFITHLHKNAESVEARVKELEAGLIVESVSAETCDPLHAKDWPVKITIADKKRNWSMNYAPMHLLLNAEAQLATAQDDERKACVKRIRGFTFPTREHDEAKDWCIDAILTPTVKESAPEKEGPLWTTHDGGPCPLKDEEVEEWEATFRDGQTRIYNTVVATCAPNRFIWEHMNKDEDDITAYRVLKWKPGFGPDAKADTPPAQVPPVNHEACHERNRNIRDSVDALLEQAGFHSECSIRNQLSWMNFDLQPGQFDSKNA